MPSKLEQLQQQYRRQLLQEKEERMIKIHTDNQQKALSKVAKYNGGIQAPGGLIKAPSAIVAPQPHHSPIKKGSPGVDRSRPLPPIAKEQKANSVPSGGGAYQSVVDSGARSGAHSYQSGADASQQGYVSYKSVANSFHQGASLNLQGAKPEVDSHQSGAVSYKSGIFHQGASSNQQGASTFHSIQQGPASFQSGNGSNQHSIQSTRSSPVSGSVSFQSGNGLNQTRSSPVSGSTSFQSGNGSNQHSIQSTRSSPVGGSVSFQSGNGLNQTRSSPVGGPASFQSGNGSNQHSIQSTRSSPVSAPAESAPRSASASARSRSVDLDARQSPSRAGAVNGRTPVRNGFGKPAESDSKQSVAELAKKQNQDSTQKQRQAELQRLRTNSKIREEPPSRNGLSQGAISKSSTLQKKAPTHRTAPTASSNAPKPKPTSQSPARRAAEGGRKPPGPGQEQCRVCGRNFNGDRIEKHRGICEKAARKKVKVFDATKMRVQGTEAEQFVRKGAPRAAAEPKPKKLDWRKKHNDFIEAIRQAKMVQQHLAKGGKVSDLPPPPPSDTSDYVPCPHCGRKFNEAVAERHIPKCKNILSNKRNPPAPNRRK